MFGGWERLAASSGMQPRLTIPGSPRSSESHSPFHPLLFRLFLALFFGAFRRASTVARCGEEHPCGFALPLRQPLPRSRKNNPEITGEPLEPRTRHAFADHPKGNERERRRSESMKRSSHHANHDGVRASERARAKPGADSGIIWTVSRTDDSYKRQHNGAAASIHLPDDLLARR